MATLRFAWLCWLISFVLFAAKIPAPKLILFFFGAGFVLSAVAMISFFSGRIEEIKQRKGLQQRWQSDFPPRRPSTVKISV